MVTARILNRFATWALTHVKVDLYTVSKHTYVKISNVFSLSDQLVYYLFKILYVYNM